MVEHPISYIIFAAFTPSTLSSAYIVLHIQLMKMHTLAYAKSNRVLKKRKMT